MNKKKSNKKKNRTTEKKNKKKMISKSKIKKKKMKGGSEQMNININNHPFEVAQGKSNENLLNNYYFNENRSYLKNNELRVTLTHPTIVKSPELIQELINAVLIKNSKETGMISNKITPKIEDDLKKIFQFCEDMSEEHNIELEKIIIFVIPILKYPENSNEHMVLLFNYIKSQSKKEDWNDKTTEEKLEEITQDIDPSFSFSKDYMESLSRDSIEAELMRLGENVLMENANNNNQIKHTFGKS